MDQINVKRGPGRPSLDITKTDPRVPIDVRRSTRQALHLLRQKLEQEHGLNSKLTLDDVIKHLLLKTAS